MNRNWRTYRIRVTLRERFEPALVGGLLDYQPAVRRYLATVYIRAGFHIAYGDFLEARAALNDIPPSFGTVSSLPNDRDLMIAFRLPYLEPISLRQLCVRTAPRERCAMLRQFLIAGFAAKADLSLGKPGDGPATTLAFGHPDPIYRDVLHLRPDSTVESDILNGSVRKSPKQQKTSRQRPR